MALLLLLVPSLEVPAKLLSQPNPSPDITQSAQSRSRPQCALHQVVSQGGRLHSNRIMCCLSANSPTTTSSRVCSAWGTYSGLDLVYAHLSSLVVKHDGHVLYVVNPGHGAQGILSCPWLEGSFGCFYAESARYNASLSGLASKFSAPRQLPKVCSSFAISTQLSTLTNYVHAPGFAIAVISAQTPGAIYEGGELGYVFIVAFGAVMDNPNLVVACVVGDSESKTGPTASYATSPRMTNVFSLVKRFTFRPSPTESSLPTPPPFYRQKLSIGRVSSFAMCAGRTRAAAG
ncbi:XFP N-terminal domain-containing protein [Phellopilus nigrolimitatus]|nr:XFP N-terminal domain-containing protein [Phellopilus nigrolimitatus]